MRWLLVLSVFFQLLLRGAAVPHARATHADVPCHADRLHVHLAGHPHRHCHARDDRHDGHGHPCRHHHEGHDSAAEGAACDAAPEEPSPDDDSVIYLVDGPMLTAAKRLWPARAAVDWLVTPIACADVAAPVLGVLPRRVRPPGDGVSTISTLFPHVLRV